MNRCILILALSFLHFVAVAKNGFTEVQNETEWKAALSNAKVNSKLILVDLYADWCGYCKLMDRNVFANKDYQQQLQQRYVLVKMNGEKEFGHSFVEKYGIQGFPTFLFFNEAEKLIEKVEGYNDLNAFSKITQNLFERITSKRKLDKKFAKGKLNNQELAHYYSLTNNLNDKKQISEKLLRELSDEKLISGPYDLFLFAISDQFEQRSTRLLLQNKETLVNRNGAIMYEQFVENLFNTTMDAVIASGDKEDLLQLEEELLPAYVNDAAALPQAKLILRKLYHGNRAEWQAYETIVHQQWQKYPANGQHYTEAYALLDSYIDSPMAMALAEKWLLLGLEEKDDFRTNLMLAVVQLMQGNTAAGKNSLDKADKLAKTEEEKQRIQELRQMAEEG